MSDNRGVWVELGQAGERWLGAGQHALWVSSAVLVASLVTYARGAILGRSKRATAARRSLTDKARPLLGYKDDASKFIEWPRHDDRTGAVIGCRVAAHSWDKAVTNAPKIELLIHQLVGGEWSRHDDVMHDRIKFTRKAPPFTWPTLLSYTDLSKPPRDRIALGIVEGGGPCTWDLAVHTDAHGLIVGITGAGKTNAVRLVLTGFALLGATIDVLDAKGGEDFEDFATHPGIRVTIEPADMLRVVDEFKAEMNRRKPTRGAERAALPRRVLIIDESAEVMVAIGSLGKAGASYVPDLLTCARLCRAMRMHIVLATQQPTATALTGNAVTGSQLRSLLGFRMGLGQLDKAAANMAFAADAPPVPKVIGRGVVQANGEFTTVQLAKLDMDEGVQIAAAGTGTFAVKQPVKEPVKDAVNPGNTGSTDASSQPSPDAPTYAAVDVTCTSCGRSYSTTSKSTAQCRCGHRQRVKRTSPAAV